MAKVVGEVAIDVTADIGPLVRQMKRGEGAMDGLRGAATKAGRGLQNFGDRAERLGKTMSVVSAGIASVATGAFLLAKSTADAGDAIAKNARQVGVATDYYQEMQFAIGQITDLSGPDLDTALQRLTRNIGEAAQGSKTAIDAFEQIGISQEELAAGTVTTQRAFDAYIAKMDGLKDPTIAAAISAELLGRSGANLGAQLSGTSGDVNTLRADAQRLGIVLSKDALAASETFGDQTDALAQSFEGLKRKLGAELLPLFTQTLLPLMQNQIIPAIGAVVDKVADWVRAFNDLPDGVQAAAGAIAAAFAAGGPVVLAIGVAAKVIGGLVAAAGPIGLLIAAAATLYTAWQVWGDDFKAAVGGAITFVSGKFDALLAKIDSIIERLKTFATQVKQALGGVTGDALNLPGVSVPDPTEGAAANPFNLPGVRVPDPTSTTGSGGGSNSGAALADGIVNGFAARMQEHMPLLQEISKIPENVFRQTTETNSPSQVFHRLGTYLGDGMADGITESSALVAEAARNMGGIAVSEAENSVSGVLSALGNLFQGSKKISAGIALANSWLAFTEVLKDPSFVGRPFARFAAAASALSSGLNAVKNIKSASAGGGAAGAGVAAAATPAQQPLDVRLNTYGAGDFIRGADFGQLLDGLNEAAGDRGYRLMLGT